MINKPGHPPRKLLLRGDEEAVSASAPKPEYRAQKAHVFKAKLFYFLFLAACLLLFQIAKAAEIQQSRPNAYRFGFTTIDGAPLPLETYRGKVVLIVNTASNCAFTPQYASLQQLWETYRERGLVVIAVPSNDFGAQEPGSGSEIKKFTEEKFSVTFPVAGKLAVTGDDAHPFFRWVREEKGFLASPKWNFYKYLISREGNLVEWYSSGAEPNSASLVQAVERELAR